MIWDSLLNRHQFHELVEKSQGNSVVLLFAQFFHGDGVKHGSNTALLSIVVRFFYMKWKATQKFKYFWPIWVSLCSEKIATAFFLLLLGSLHLGERKNGFLYLLSTGSGRANTPISWAGFIPLLSIGFHFSPCNSKGPCFQLGNQELRSRDGSCRTRKPPNQCLSRVNTAAKKHSKELRIKSGREKSCDLHLNCFKMQ